MFTVKVFSRSRNQPLWCRHKNWKSYARLKNQTMLQVFGFAQPASSWKKSLSAVSVVVRWKVACRPSPVKDMEMGAI